MNKKYGASKSDEDRQNEMTKGHEDFKAGKARRVANRKRRSEHGSGKKGKKRAAAAVAKEAAMDKLNRLGASMFAGKKAKKEAKQQAHKESIDLLKFNPVVDKSKASAKGRGGAAMYGKKHGSSMNAYQDKEASMDDYSHEKKLKADGRYEAAHGKMANAKNDFDHAHALKKDAHYDAKGRHSIMKHMKGFK
jgi:hypothetical protein